MLTGTSGKSNPAQASHHNSLVFMAAIFCRMQENRFSEAPLRPDAMYRTIFTAYPVTPVT